MWNNYFFNLGNYDSKEVGFFFFPECLGPSLAYSFCVSATKLTLWSIIDKSNIHHLIFFGG